MPTDARFETLEEMPYELTPLKLVIGELRRAKGVKNCADRRLPRQRGGKGDEAQVRPRRRGHPRPRADIEPRRADRRLCRAIPGDRRRWPSGGDSPFTAALLKYLPTPGLDVKAMLFKVGAQVKADTHGAQQPEILASIYEDYALASAVEPAPTGDGAKVDPPLDPKFAEARAAWQDLQSSTSVPLLQALATRYADTIYASSALERIAELKRREALERSPPAPKPVGPCGRIARLASLDTRGDRVLSADEACALQRGDLFRECAGCPKMAVLPPGMFTMGSLDGEKGLWANEGPRRDVTFARGFAVGEFPVTRDEFAAFVKATGYDAGKKVSHRKQEKPMGRDRRPQLAKSGLRADGLASGRVRELGRREGLCGVAGGADKAALSVVERGGMGIRGAGADGTGKLSALFLRRRGERLLQVWQRRGSDD